MHSGKKHACFQCLPKINILGEINMQRKQKSEFSFIYFTFLLFLIAKITTVSIKTRDNYITAVSSYIRLPVRFSGLILSLLDQKKCIGPKRYKEENTGNNDPARTRTWNLLIRSQAPYPLGHRTVAGTIGPLRNILFIPLNSLQTIARVLLGDKTTKI